MSFDLSMTRVYREHPSQLLRQLHSAILEDTPVAGWKFVVEGREEDGMG